jgi:beta-lactamase class A
MADRAVADRIQREFAAAGARGWLHARPVGPGTPSVGVDADEPVVLASAFKVVVAVAYAREVAAGRLDPAGRTRVTARDRTGGVGTAGCVDDVEMSWRDLALFMLTISDNAATDVVYRRVGAEAVRAVLDDVGMTGTRIIGCCEDLFATIAEDLGGTDPGEALAAATPEQIWKLRVLDPAHTTATTPRDMTTLLASVWNDTAAPPDACASVRSMLAQQVWPHRLTSGFPADVQVSGKTGTLPAIRNEVGVVTYPDSKQFAVAVFTRADSLTMRLPAVDASIGTAARLAVDELRAR